MKVPKKAKEWLDKNIDVKDAGRKDTEKEIVISNREKAIEGLVKIGYTESSAKSYYGAWKKDYQRYQGDLKKIGSTEVIKGKYSHYFVAKGKCICGDILFKSRVDIENYKNKEIEEFNKRMLELEEAYEYSLSI